MSSISWNEVRDRALRFALEWADATDEERDKQTFWNEFFGLPVVSEKVFTLSGGVLGAKEAGKARSVRVTLNTR